MLHHQVDMPGRIVVMTTNHLEKLDPALIRPGRINKILLLGYVQPEQAEQMLQHWFADQPLDDEQRATLRCALGPGSAVTPAFLEGLCADHDDVQSLLQALARRAAAMWNKGTLAAGRIDKDDSHVPPRTPPEVERGPRRRWGFFRAS